MRFQLQLGVILSQSLAPIRARVCVRVRALGVSD